jgi:hypothetical protein
MRVQPRNEGRVQPLSEGSVLRPLDRDRLRAEWQIGRPFPFIVVDPLLEPDAAREIAAAYPTFDEALALGFAFSKVNERKKVQVTDAARFPDPIRRLHDALASPGMLAALEEITGIPGLLADPALRGGGMHITSASGRLDVHADFNLLEEPRLFRRLNILVYLNERWDEPWGGALELWNRDVSRCEHAVAPKLGRCVVFETSSTSFHGVTEVRCPAHVQRQSFAAYYYTKEAPPGWDGKAHSTVFKPRPDEKLRKYVLMPAERARDAIVSRARRVKSRVARLVGRTKDVG